jgi:predicted PurR-regulated permease PerM
MAYLIFIGIFIVILLLVGSSLLNELQRLGDSLARTYDQIWQEWPEGTQVQQMIIQQMPAPADLYKSFSIDRQNSVTQALLGFTLNSFGIFGNLFAVVFLSFYWSLDQVHFERLWLSLFPVEARARYRDMWRDIERDFGSYIRSELMQSLIAGILLGLGFWWMGMPYPTLLALTSALAWLVPWLGGVLAVIPVALVGLTTNLWLGVAALVYIIAILFFLELVIEPRFLRRRQYSSLLNILLILALAEPFGLLGFIVAPPLAASIELAFRYSLQNRYTPLSIESIQRIAGLRSRIENVRTLLSNRQDDPAPQTTSLLDRLDNLVERANEVIEEENSKASG